MDECVDPGSYLAPVIGQSERTAAFGICAKPQRKEIDAHCRPIRNPGAERPWVGNGANLLNALNCAPGNATSA